jgi:hypothetical protein
MHINEMKERHTHVIYNLPVVPQECTIAPAFGDILWTSELDIHGVTVLLYYLCRFEELRGVIAAELDNKRPIRCGVAFFA